MADPVDDLRAQSTKVTARVEQAAAEVADQVKGTARRIEKEYEGDEIRPLGGYLVLMAVYLTAVGTAAVLLRRRGTRLPDQISWRDLTVAAVATHRISRLLTKDPITSPLRAPFTRYDGLSGPAELREQVKSKGGLAHAVGELLTCPFCLAQWTATALIIGHLVAPRALRIVTSVFALVGLADLLHLAYDRLER